MPCPSRGPNRNFYPRSPCGERPPVNPQLRSVNPISIHALLAESDVVIPGPAVMIPISIHALLAESDRSVSNTVTPPSHFYPRSPCGERLGLSYFYIIKITISIHALLAESDNSAYGALDGASISIHALLAESDLAGPSGPAFLYNFYPRSPCGERPRNKKNNHLPPTNFYPRSPCGERPNREKRKYLER